MHLTRRAFLKLAGQAGLAVPFAFGPSGCAVQMARGFDSDTGLWLGCVAGEVTPDGAVIWLRAEAGGSVVVEYGRDPALASSVRTDAIRVAAQSDDTAKFLLEALEPATVYYYRAVVAGKKPGPVSRFITAPAPNDSAVVKFCFSGDTRESYKPFKIMDAIRAVQPNFFIHLGDTIYADRGGSAVNLTGFWAKYRGNRDDAPSQRLFAEISVYVTWDDHEVRDNYEPGEPLAPIGQRAFLDYWPVRPDAGEPNRIYRSFRWGRGLELFLLDARQYRDRARETMLGPRQKEWLLEGLASSTAPFKIVATSVPLYGGGRDRWDGFPKERDQLIQWIRQKKIEGVTFISADLHHAAVAQISRRSSIREIIVGPLAAPMNALGIGYSAGMEFFANKTFNFGMIIVDSTSSPPQMLLEIRDEDNGVLYKTRIAAA